MDNRHIIDKALKVFIPFEVIIKKIIIILFFFLLASQLLLLNSATRNYISKIDKLEGNTLASIEAIPASQIKENQQWIELLLLEDLPRSEIVVYIDGIHYASFHQLQLNIPIDDGQTISVLAKGIPGIFTIQILDVSHNSAIDFLPGKVLEVSENTPLIIEL